jgi:hypothetical protein
LSASLWAAPFREPFIQKSVAKSRTNMNIKAYSRMRNGRIAKEDKAPRESLRIEELAGLGKDY